MTTCEDYPCCGHESGRCPDFDDDGKQVNMRCTCGATIPVDSRFSICESCLGLEDDYEYEDDDDDWYDDDWDDYWGNEEEDELDRRDKKHGLYGGYEDSSN